MYLEVVDDVECGVYSVLERAFIREYQGYRLRFFHTSAQGLKEKGH
jgi:hypothetical protein